DLSATIVGRRIDRADVRRRLEQVGCEVRDGDPLEVKPPSWRPDLAIPVDLVEEVIRLEGFESIPSTLPTAPAGRGLTREQRLRRRLGRAFAATGFAEAHTFRFVAPRVADALGLAAGDARGAMVRVANPLSEDESVLRSSLLPGLFAAVVRNVARGFSDVALSEMGHVF